MGKRLASILAIAALLTGLLPSTALAATRRRTAASVTATAGCSTPAPTTAAEYEQLIRGPINGKVYTGDSGHSVKLPNGKVLWLFGDTFVRDATQSQGGVFINNAAILTDQGCATALTGPADASGNPTSWIKPVGSFDLPAVNDYYWNSTAYVEDTTLYVFLLHMVNDASGFHTIGTDIASFDVSGATPQLQALFKTPGSTNGEVLPTWGTAIMPATGYLYVYGRTYTPGPFVFGHNHYIARVPKGKKVTNPGAWQYWNGKSWVNNQAKATIIVQGVEGMGSGATVYQKPDRTYVFISKRYDIVGTDIVAWTAPAPQGPWTVGPALVAPIPDVNTAAGEVTYFGISHREVTLPSGNLLLTWSLNSTDAAWFGNPRYGVHFTEVPQL